MAKKQTAQETAEPSTEGRIRIGELARRAGVARGTIQHYLREGLLPQPLKTFRNMAYYDPACVEQIRVIKELQEKSRLPLTEIREIIASDEGTQALTSAIRHAQHAALEAVASASKGAVVWRDEAGRHFGLPDTIVDQLVQHRIVTEHTVDGRRGFKGADLEVLATLKELRHAGFNEDNGFEIAQLVMYREALEKLLEREVATFMQVFVARGEIRSDITQKAVSGASMLLLALRKKSVADFMEQIDTLMPDVPSFMLGAKAAPPAATADKSKPKKTARKKSTAKKAAARKSPARKSPARKSPARKSG